MSGPGRPTATFFLAMGGALLLAAILMPILVTPDDPNQSVWVGIGIEIFLGLVAASFLAGGVVELPVRGQGLGWATMSGCGLILGGTAITGVALAFWFIEGPPWTNWAAVAKLADHGVRGPRKAAYVVVGPVVGPLFVLAGYLMLRQARKDWKQAAESTGKAPPRIQGDPIAPADVVDVGRLYRRFPKRPA